MMKSFEPFFAVDFIEPPRDMHYVGHRENGTYRHITITRLYHTIFLNDY
jgi:hypothetical protein